jgi:hypothetical protein
MPTPLRKVEHYRCLTNEFLANDPSIESQNYYLQTGITARWPRPCGAEHNAGSG